MKFEGSTALEAVDRRQSVKIQQIEENLVRAVANRGLCELALALLVITLCKC
jgi:hypothetical protein